MNTKNICARVLQLSICCYLLSCTNACSQANTAHQHAIIKEMDTNKIENNIVKQAILAWQEGDPKKWLPLFSEKAVLLDDGNPRNFKTFSSKAIGTERFTSIDKIEDNGLSVYGSFHSDTWGDFKTYFRFHIDPAGKIYQLDIGQADY